METLPYLRAGRGPTLVLVHGYLGGAAQWEREIEWFSRSYDVIAPDLPGFGAAADRPGEATISGMARAITKLLDELGIDTFTLLGHSMGGMIAQEIAATRPKAVRKLILYGTGPVGLMPDRFEPIAVSRQRVQRDGVAKTIARIGATWFKDGERARGYGRLVEIGERANPQAALAALDAMAAWDGRQALGALSMPTLVIWGDSDRSYRWPQIETLWRGIPNVDLSVVPCASHALHLEKPDLFRAILLEFIR
ncbi:alpha/beta hydrolase [Notoacmeibacter marinus]|uniref:Alpha/beta hydrolase n=1 Tax=Notoacmeibacter marinus TaxID=1876515 RepID=A0A231V206_9HYPH|nr:alpha/beta hydrolase [Notoacmeibacter marinus]OXT02144.1 alpha/beta hydrolase [Notoacmeibacter marinus]